MAIYISFNTIHSPKNKIACTEGISCSALDQMRALPLVISTWQPLHTAHTHGLLGSRHPSRLKCRSNAGSFPCSPWRWLYTNRLFIAAYILKDALWRKTAACPFLSCWLPLSQCQESQMRCGSNLVPARGGAMWATHYRVGPSQQF